MHCTIRITTLLTLAGLAPHALAQPTYWLNGDEGHWLTPANWSAGVPTDGTTAYINNGGRAHVSLDGCAARVLYVGQDVDESGGIRISGGRLDTISITWLGYEGTATITQTGGEFVAVSSVNMGSGITGTCSYTLSGGLLQVGGESLAGRGAATFEQNGGTHEVLGTLRHANNAAAAPTYTLNDGDLIANEEELGSQGTATMLQTGGTHTVTTDFYLGVSASSLNNEYDLLGGELNVGTEYLGYWGSAEISQSGGTHTITGNLWMGNGNGSAYPDCRGTYNLTGGTLDVQSHLCLANEARNNLFEQTGGTATVAFTFFVGYSGPSPSNASGTCRLRGGNLEVGNLEVARNSAYGYLRLLSPAAMFTVHGDVLLHNRAVLAAVPGATIHLTGPAAAFQNEQRFNQEYLEQLRFVQLIFEGGTTDVATYEVACLDYGASFEGYHENDGNMALGTLTLGGDDFGRVRLVDEFVNQGGTQAVYVNTLNAGPGSYLDLNGFNLYYIHGQIDPSATIVGGTPVQLIAGDYDENGVVDLADYPALPDCSGGPGAEVGSDCWVFDFDIDGDVDIDDFAGFQRAMGGS